MTLKHLRSSTLNKRPQPSGMADGQLALNTASGSPGLFFKDTNGSLVKIGPVHVGSAAPNASPASGGTSGNSLGEQWLDTSGGGYLFKIWDGATWRSETGEFVNASGDTMTGPLVLGPSASLIFEGSTDDGFETTLTVVDPTADNTITLPNISGTVVTTGDTGSVTSTMILNGTIVNADVNASAAIDGTKISPNFGSQTVQTTGVFTAASGTASAPSIAFTADTNTGFYSPGADQLAISTNGTGRLFVDASGRVGIGTTSPGARLGVQEGSAGQAIVLYSTDGNGAGFIGTTDQASTSNGIVVNANRASGSIVLQTISQERARIDNSGRLLLGTSSSRAQASLTGQIQLEGTTSSASTLQIINNSSASTAGGIITLGKTRAGTIGGTTIVSSGDLLGEIRFAGADGAGTQVPGGSIQVQCDGTPGTNDMPGRLILATTADGASSPSERMRIDNQGRIGFNSTSLGGNSGQYRFAGSITGAVSSQGIVYTPTVQPDVTTTATIFNSQPSTAANAGTPYTVTNLYGYFASQGTFNADSTVTSQYGFAAASSLTGATNNYGFISALSAATGRWNFYAAGTANNYFAGSVGIGTTSPTVPLEVSADSTVQFRLVRPTGVDLRLNSYFGNSDLASLSVVTNHPLAFHTNNTERVRIDSSGRLLVGTSASTNNARLDQKIAVVGTTANYPGISVTGYVGSTLADFCPLIDLQRSRGTTDGSLTVVANGDALGRIAFRGADGTNFRDAATINAFVDGTPGASDMPGRLVFSTTADGASSPTERMRITNAGNVGIGTTSPLGNLHIEAPATSAGWQLRLDSVGLANESGFFRTASDNYEIALRNAAGGLSYLTNTGGASTSTLEFVVQGSERARIDSSGRLLVGTSTAVAATTLTPYFQVHGTSNNVHAGFGAWQNDPGAPGLYFAKSRGTSVGSQVIVQNNDFIGALQFEASDGTQLVRAASITAQVDGTPGANDMPGRLVFSTTADGASSPTERMRITSAGNAGIGGTPSAGRRLFLSGGATGSTSTRGLLIEQQIQSDVTTDHTGVLTSISAAAASFTLTNIQHYGTFQGGFGAGSTVTNQYGFNAGSSLIGATNNFGFYSDIASGANRWNFYANGTAASRFNGNVLIGGTIQPASATRALCLSNGTAPTGSITDGVVLYAEDVSASSELKVRDEAGNVTTLSPHNFDLIPDGPSEDMAWSYYSERDGKRINVDMLKAIRLLEQISGEKLVYSS